MFAANNNKYKKHKTIVSAEKFGFYNGSLLHYLLVLKGFQYLIFEFLSFDYLACFCVYDVIENRNMSSGDELIQMK